MKILCIRTISSLFLILHFLINYVVVPGDAVVVILNKGMIRKPQPARKQSASVVIVAGPIRRNTQATKSKNWRVIKNWISRVLRKNGRLRSQTCCRKHNITGDNKRSFSNYRNKKNLNS